MGGGGGGRYFLGLLGGGFWFGFCRMIRIFFDGRVGGRCWRVRKWVKKERDESGVYI